MECSILNTEMVRQLPFPPNYFMKFSFNPNFIGLWQHYFILIHEVVFSVACSEVLCTGLLTNLNYSLLKSLGKTDVK